MYRAVEEKEENENEKAECEGRRQYVKAVCEGRKTVLAGEPTLAVILLPSQEAGGNTQKREKMEWR